ncbi:MAG: PhoH family protein [Pseudomonadota bacterium]
MVIPLAVIEEIDNQKKRQDKIGRNAREISRILDELRSWGNLSQGVPLPDGGTVRIEVNHSGWGDRPEGLEVLDSSKTDNRILAVGLNLVRKENNGPVILVSKDLNLRVKADVLGLQAEDLTTDKVDFSRLYSGQGDLILKKEELDAFYHFKKLPVEKEWPILPHQFMVLKSADHPSVSGLARRDGDYLVPLNTNNGVDVFGLRARNKEQLFSLDLLMNDQIKIVTLAGGAGTCKTLLALAAALELILEKNLFDKLLVTRPVIPVDGQDLGFLPGDKKEKIRPWMQPIFDNLEYLFHSSHSQLLASRKDKTSRSQGPEGQLDMESYLSFAGRIELEALSYIRGRSIARQFILVDEAQNCTPHAIKSLLTRVGDGSKIVFTGDVEQIDHPYLDSASNGLTILIEKLKNVEIAGHVTLVKGERSAVAELGAKIL